jgi:hypothetical protein
MAGAVQMVVASRFELILSNVASSYRPGNRDVLTAAFLQSDATHLLCINSDIGWGPADVERLLLANQDFTTGIYAKKQANGAPVAVFLERREGDLIEVDYTGAGFLLLTRRCIERMVAGYPELQYASPNGPLCALWSPKFDGRTYSEDRTFCARWRALGGSIWAHSQVVLKRYGETTFVPRDFTLKAVSK